MNIHQAINLAADHIERHPDQFNFLSVKLPSGCGTPGCALGWVGHFMGMTGIHMGEVAGVLGYTDTPTRDDDGQFYDDMKAFDPDWRYDAQVCADTLRKYADKHHAIDSVEAIPESVLAIFQQEVAA